MEVLNIGQTHQSNLFLVLLVAGLLTVCLVQAGKVQAGSRSGWTGTINASGSPDQTENKCISVSSNPLEKGSVKLTPPGKTYRKGTEVTLTAEPGENYHFDNWSGGITGTDNQITITMDSDKTVTANFSRIENTSAVDDENNNEGGSENGEGGDLPLPWIGIGIVLAVLIGGSAALRK